MGDAEDFWPAIDDTEDLNSPVVLLRKQADILTTKSGHRLRGRVSTSTINVTGPAANALGAEHYSPAFAHTFYIEVPSLDDYSYSLFTILHGIDPYPVAHQDTNNVQGFLDAGQFTAWLRETLSSDKTKRILKTLSEQAIR
jgi:hypothetical protein